MEIVLLFLSCVICLSFLVNMVLVDKDEDWILVVVATHFESNNKIEEILGPNDNILYCGVGKINATYNLTNYLKTLKNSGKKMPFVLNVGACGSANYNIGTTLEINKFIQKDMDSRGLGYELTLTPGDTLDEVGYGALEIEPILNEYTISNCCTADTFVTKEKACCDAHDMEAYAFASVCHRMNIGFYSVKYVVDNLDGHIGDEWNPEISDMNNKFVEIYEKICKKRKFLPKNNVINTKEALCPTSP